MKRKQAIPEPEPESEEEMDMEEEENDDGSDEDGSEQEDGQSESEPEEDDAEDDEEEDDNDEVNENEQNEEINTRREVVVDDLFYDPYNLTTCNYHSLKFDPSMEIKNNEPNANLENLFVEQTTRAAQLLYAK
jgi:cobalamin biosynthesis protein CobT